ncbi:uncharacterized protein J3D65DRAFT_307686 [Phyllosticta citribraziliensis]|uniref:Uncharacterized protein n=1 Tax=Phyllosticta citribraziliensis TaxID=989973 RepID=A0ABR1LXY0_9PEZI
MCSLIPRNQIHSKSLYSSATVVVAVVPFSLGSLLEPFHLAVTITVTPSAPSPPRYLIPPHTSDRMRFSLDLTRRRLTLSTSYVTAAVAPTHCNCSSRLAAPSTWTNGRSVSDDVRFSLPHPSCVSFTVARFFSPAHRSTFYERRVLGTSSHIAIDYRPAFHSSCLPSQRSPSGK